MINIIPALLGFILGLFIQFLVPFSSLNTYFQLYPITWDGVSAILTFVAVCAALFENWTYRKRERQIEHREIIEKIIQPLIADCKKIISAIPRFRTSDFKWEQIKRGHFYLASRGIDDTLIEQLDSFSEENKRYPEIIRPLIEYLNRVFFEEALFCLGKRGSFDDQRVMSNLSANGPGYMEGLIIAQRGLRSATFLPLIFYDTTIQQFFEINKDPTHPIHDEDMVTLYFLGQAIMREAEIENIMDSLRKKVRDYNVQYERIKYARNFLMKTKALLDQLEKYLKRML